MAGDTIWVPDLGFEYHENKIVQYFEKARMEWQPWKVEGQRVVISDLGRIYFDKLGEDVGLLSPVKPANTTPIPASSITGTCLCLEGCDACK